jgi:hypothetical protein
MDRDAAEVRLFGQFEITCFALADDYEAQPGVGRLDLELHGVS